MQTPDCPHCDVSGFAYAHTLEETPSFRVVCDVHPLEEGHLLIIAKDHVSCMGALPPAAFEEFQRLYDSVNHRLSNLYSTTSTFEHGIVGQSVFHAHTHLVPFNGQATDIVPEGIGSMHGNVLKALPDMFSRESRYLFFSIGEESWTVDATLAAPRFFRDRFARALRKPERGDWKWMRTDARSMREARLEIDRLNKRWSSLSKD
ncbi:HIT domain-containing protein [Candidatus Peregrinibacteria bacterium]|nr:HIT domain-containing protein [Candidatus Peregrinibacteria bacterium]